MAASSLQFNDNHLRTLQVGFRHIDKLIDDGLVGLRAENESEAVFATVVPDATPVQQKVIADQVARLRRAMRKALERLGVAISAPSVSALWNLRTHLNFVDVALEELGPRHLRGYGEIAPEAAKQVEVALSELRAILAEFEAYLGGGSNGDLAARLRRLDQTRDEVALLQTLERMIATHGLVQFRPTLSHLLEQAEHPRWTVAFVGRVSCGKSSLLNFLLETSVLPSGVTPVTAVPIRIIPGTAPRATVSFAVAAPQQIPAGELHRFAAEEENPGNARHVTDIVVELPSHRLAGDICLVDTPGLGSLATSGAAQTWAFLPRCDVGVLLVDAGATLTPEDLAVARALTENGATVLIVLSKADLLQPADLEKMKSYIAARMTAELEIAPAIADVSVTGDQSIRAVQWWEHEMLPRLREHRELSRASLRRRIGSLREAVVRELERARKAGPAGDNAESSATIAQVRASFEQTKRAIHEIQFRSLPAANETLRAIALRLRGHEDDENVSQLIATELGQVAANLAAQFEGRLNQLRAEVMDAISEHDAPGSEIPGFSSRPLFDPTPLVSGRELRPRHWPTAAARGAIFRRMLRVQLQTPLEEALRNYGRTLTAWATAALEKLSAHFEAHGALVEASGTSSHSASDVEPDLALLRRWNERPAA